MSNTYQNSSTAKPSGRYTIPCLLQLAHGRRPFDLSKFSYDAARAGVVPPLGDCAMSSRRSSSTRARGWSSASFETSEDIVVFGGNMNGASIVQPDRQPVNPPPEGCGAKDAGFARFLKKHSSPTHNRVTAGGRIVPMEKRESPPRLNLPASLPRTGQEEVHVEKRMACKSLLIGVADDQEPTARNGNGVLVQTNNIKQLVVDETAKGSAVVANDTSETTASSAQAPHQTISNANVVSHSVQENQFNPYISPAMQQNVSNHFLAQLAYSSMQSTMPYSSYAWPFAGAYNMAVVNANANFHPEPQMQLLWSGRQMLVDAEALFNNLDRQLKLIDRHRAMNTHDPNLSAQRMAIVQQRADAKETVKRLKVQFGFEQDQYHHQGTIPFTAAMTPDFVPNAIEPVQQPAPTPIITPDGLVRALASAQKSRPIAKRKPLPIVQPPPSSTSQAEPCKKTNVSIMAKPSVKVKDIQDSNQRENVELSNELDGQKSPATNKSTTPEQKSASDEKPGRRETGESAKKKQDDEGKTKGRVCQAEWMQTQTGETPSAVEAIYELQLDAMRLPEGVDAIISLSNGSRVNVQGCKLGRPSASLMSDFEQDYWDRKPMYTMEMLQGLKSQAMIKDSSIMLTDEYLVTNADGPPASPTKSRSSPESEHHQRVEKYFEDQPRSLQDHAVPSHVSAKSELSVVYDAVGRDRQVVSAGGMITTTRRPSDDDLRSQDEIMADGMSHKGYSSVSIQTVNVQVQLPPPGFDGATDPNRRSAAVSSLTAAGKQRSPRLLHRSAPNGGAWYGPHCRQVREQAFSDGNP